MRAPAQHRRPGRTAAPGWTHPYTGIPGLAVFYNDGGNPPAVPTPADLVPPQRKNTPVELRDPETGLVMTQERFAQNMAKERRAGRHAALREIAEAAGITDFDLDTFDASRFGQMFKEAQAARQAQLTEEQRQAEALEQQAKELADREAKAQQLIADAQRRDRETRIRSALVRLGATGEDLDDAAALIRVPDDADDAAIAEAADKLKERRSELFGVSPAPKPGTLPPAPGGAPAGAPPARTVPSKDDAKARALARAQAMGYARKPDAA